MKAGQKITLVCLGAAYFASLFFAIAEIRDKDRTIAALRRACAPTGTAR